MSQPYKKARLDTPEKRVAELLACSDFDDDWDEIINKENCAQNGNSVSDSVDLSGWNRVTVEEITRDQFDLVINVRTHTQNEKGRCRVQSPWNQVKLSLGDTISLKAVWSPKYNGYVVNSESGYLINLPDQLISGTTVMGSLFCQRKGVLQEFFKGMGPDNEIMVVGTIIHELLERVLRQGLKTVQEIKTCSSELIQSPDINFMLYSSRMTQEKLESEVKLFIPKISRFVHQYLEGNATTDSGNVVGKISEVKDIEENIWLPQMGLKGKVDVTVEFCKENDNTKRMIMPLELKTGRASFSGEHKGQVILYQMMMEEMGQDVRSGLLFYLREGILREITATRNEQRDLLMLRNEMGYFLSRKYFQDFKNNKFLQLPDPINRRNICENCPYNTICSLVLKRDQTRTPPSNHPLKVGQPIDHLCEEDLDYFFHWSHIMLMEDEENLKSNSVKRIWTESIPSRVDNGTAIGGLKIVKINNEIGGRFVHEFESNLDLKTSHNFKTDDYVVVSHSTRFAIANGYLVKLENKRISINLDRQLKGYLKEEFVIDKYESQSMLSYHLTNLGLLMDNSPISQKLREIIITKKVPEFEAKLPKEILKGKEILSSLNKNQQEAVLKALAVKDFLLIKGLPGTGKTQILVALIRLLTLLGKSILITSHTHSAVDNLLIRLKEHNLSFLRLGSTQRTMPELHEFCDGNIIGQCSSPEEIKSKYNSFQIVAVTCLGANHSLLSERVFDFGIVDESTQVLQTAILRPLFSVEKFILVGDPDQLPPLLKSHEAKELGGDESLFAKLDRDSTTTVTLNLQYRMNRSITKLANQLTYKMNLKCANEAVERKTIEKINMDFQLDENKWLERPLSSHLDLSCVLVNTGNTESLNSGFKTKIVGHPETVSSKITVNYVEAVLILRIIEELLTSQFCPGDIGIIAPYRIQVDYLRKVIKNSEIEVNTVDQYQGRDKDVIIYSGTKSQLATEKRDLFSGDILEDRRRLNVAVTRAKRKLIIICDTTTLEKNNPFKEMFKYFRGPQLVNLSDPKLKIEFKGLLEENETKIKL